MSHLYHRGVNIRGLFLYREPLDTLASTLERKFRLHEVFDGKVDDYADYIYHSLLYSNKLGLDLAEKYDFHKICYENMEEEYPNLMEFMNIREYKKIDYKRKYGRRFVLNPNARNYFEHLKPCGMTLGYNYPKKITVSLYFRELTFYQVYL